jgi:hypothetical protein
LNVGRRRGILYPRREPMRRPAIMVCVLILATACAKSPGPAPALAGRTEPSPSIDPQRVGIYEAVVRSQIEFRGEHVWIYDQICEDAEAAGESDGRCPEAFSADEQRALLEALSDVRKVEFVSNTAGLTDRIFDGDVAGQIIRVGPIVERNDRIEVAASHYCGGLCGGGSTWHVRQTADGWEVIGPAPGHGVWIS